VAAVIAAAFPLAALAEWLRLGMPLFAREDGLAARILWLASMTGAFVAAMAIRNESDLKRRLGMLSCSLLCLAGIGLSLRSRDAIRGAWLLTLCQGLVMGCGMLVIRQMEARRADRDPGTLSEVSRRYPRLGVMLTLLLILGAGVPVIGGTAGLVLQTWASGQSVWSATGQVIVMLVLAATGTETLAKMLAPRPASGGESRSHSPLEPPDLCVREIVPVGALLILVLLLNAMPSIVSSRIERDLQRIHPARLTGTS
jgi:formate hydrogenlyase subunit 3/multisubunit Na+/H+ antiporter MnhD subunit